MPLPYNLIYLKYFCDAARSGNISHSAKANFVSQSAISQAIHKLEKGLGTTLITHQQNRFRLTPEGETVFQKSRDIFASCAALEEALSAPTGKISGRLEFACTHSFALAVLPQHIKQLGRRFPKLHVNFRLGHTGTIKELIRKGVIDFGIVLDNEDLSGFQCREIYHGSYRLFYSGRYDKKKPAHFIISEELMETNLLRRAYRKKFRKELPVRMEVSSWEVIAKLTEEGLGIGFFPDYVALGRKSLKEYPSGLAPIPYRIYAIFPPSTPLHKNQEAFLSSFTK
jgi:DNA-binding transcriptional LysR family regulator